VQARISLSGESEKRELGTTVAGSAQVLEDSTLRELLRVERGKRT